MAHKRFTDVDKWDDPFFMELSNKYKLFWQLMLDKCDNAGIYKVNFKTAKFLIGEDFDYQETASIFKDRIIELSKEKWFIPKFIHFQYGELTEECHPHKPIIKILKNEDLMKYIEKDKGINTLRDTLKIRKDKIRQDNKGGMGEERFNPEVVKIIHQTAKKMIKD